jgi:Na+/melibiose symporter-like transporter
MDNSKLSVKEKIGYGMGDAGCNIIFGAIMLFVNYFYTDIFGLAPALVGVLLLSIRVIDAITDPIMGAIADRTKQVRTLPSMAFVDCLTLCRVQRADVYHAGLDLP